MLLYFVEPKHPSGNCYVRCFLTDKTALDRPDSTGMCQSLKIWVQVHTKAVLSVRKQLTKQLPEGCFGPTKYNIIDTFEQIVGPKRRSGNC